MSGELVSVLSGMVSVYVCTHVFKYTGDVLKYVSSCGQRLTLGVCLPELLLHVIF